MPFIGKEKLILYLKKWQSPQYLLVQKVKIWARLNISVDPKLVFLQ